MSAFICSQTEANKRFSPLTWMKYSEDTHTHTYTLFGGGTHARVSFRWATSRRLLPRRVKVIGAAFVLLWPSSDHFNGFVARRRITVIASVPLQRRLSPWRRHGVTRHREWRSHRRFWRTCGTKQESAERKGLFFWSPVIIQVEGFSL